MSVAKWDRSKDGMPDVLTNNPNKNPIDVNKQAKLGTKIQRNKIGQAINR